MKVIIRFSCGVSEIVHVNDLQHKQSINAVNVIKTQTIIFLSAINDQKTTLASVKQTIILWSN